MDPGTALGLSAGVQALSTGFGLWGDNQNLKFQKEKLAYDKGIQERIFQREDNAVQRKASDLQQAGLSKTLAAGSGAQAGAVVKTEAPRTEKGQIMSQTAQGAMQMMQMQENIAQSESQQELNYVQKYKIKQDEHTSHQNELIGRAQEKLINQQTQNAKHNYNVAYKWGTPTGADPQSMLMGAGLKAGGSLFKKYKKYPKKLLDYLKKKLSR